MLLFGGAVERGIRGAVPFALGLTLGKLLLLTLAILGVAKAAVALGPLFVAVKIAGGAYLIWLGVRLWRRDGAAVPGPAASTPRDLARACAAGLLLTITNLQAILFYVAVLPHVLGSEQPTPSQFAALATTLVLVMALIAGGYIVLALRVRGALTARRARRTADRLAGALLIATAALVTTR
jgi:threonine/homoserine/homoserine lactone efflux protein